MTEEEVKKPGYQWGKKDKEEDEEAEDRKRQRIGTEEAEWWREVRKTVERTEKSVERVRSEMAEMYAWPSG